MRRRTHRGGRIRRRVVRKISDMHPQEDAVHDSVDEDVNRAKADQIGGARGDPEPRVIRFHPDAVHVGVNMARVSRKTTAPKKQENQIAREEKVGRGRIQDKRKLAEMC
jgi:hypothetical protein